MASGRAAPGFRPEKIGTKPCTSLTQIIYQIQLFYKTKEKSSAQIRVICGNISLQRTSNFAKKDLLSFTTKQVPSINLKTMKNLS